MPSAIGLIKVASPGEIEAERRAIEESENVVALPESMLMDSLAAHVKSCFEEAYNHKTDDQTRFRDAAYARRGEYPPEKLRQIMEQGASTEYARIVANKSRILESWLKDVFLTNGERPWSISATPSPDLPQETLEAVRMEISQEVAAAAAAGQAIDPQAVRQQLSDRIDIERTRIKGLADRRAERMEELIADQMHEGGYERAMSDFLAYLVTYPGAILKGPIFRHKRKVKWTEVDGTYIPEVSRDIHMQFEAVDPNNIYPAPGARNPQEGYIIEHSVITAAELFDLIEVEGYDEAAIRAVLDRAGDKGLRWVDRTTQNSSETNDNDRVTLTDGEAAHASYIDMITFHGPISGKKLKEWGVEAIRDEHEYYEATVYQIDRHVIKAELNDDPMGRRPYYKACYEEIPGQFWGYSLYDVLADVQGVGNAAVRSLVNNMAITSGPQVTVDVDRLPAGEDITNLHPWKIWQVRSGQFNTSSRAIDFYQPTSNITELMATLEKFYALADDFSLIPRYMSGNEKMSGPGRTATGLSMLLDAANKGLKGIVQGIDANVMTPLLEFLYDHNMLFSDDESIKGDSQVVARGVASLMQLETMRLRRNEFLQITANPIDSQIVGLKGRASVLREIAKGLGMDVNKVVPPDTQIPNQPMVPPGQPGMLPSPGGQIGSNEVLPDGQAVADVASPSQMT